MNEDLRDSFLRTAQAWVSDGYHVSVRYLTADEGTRISLFAALVAFDPLPPPPGMEFHLKVGRIAAGQIHLRAERDAHAMLQAACSGELTARSTRVSFGGVGKFDYFSDNPDPNRAGVDLHLRVTTENHLSFTASEIAEIDSQLRRASPPFDGMLDVCTWLGLPNPFNHGRQSSIDIRINPPVDFDSELKLENDALVITLKAVANTDLSDLELALRCAPAEGLGRFLVGRKVQWSPPDAGVRRGRVALQLTNADVVQCMLSLGPQTIRRQVIVDRTRARTLRLAAVMAMDPGLSALSQSLRRSDRDRDAARFEKGVATILFVYGFIPTPQADTNAPDLLVGTPGGRLALVECTLKFTEFNAKVAKLATRRNRLVQELRVKGHATDVHAVLVCASPRAEIVGLDDLVLANQAVTLVTAETLQLALDRVQTGADPDELLNRASAALIDAQRRSTPM